MNVPETYETYVDTEDEEYQGPHFGEDYELPVGNPVGGPEATGEDDDD